MSTYDAVTNTTGTVLQFTVQNADGNARDCSTDLSIQLLWIDADGVLQTVNAVAVDAANGIFKYTFGAAEIMSDSQKFEVKVTDAGGKIIRSLDLITLTTRESIEP